MVQLEFKAVEELQPGPKWRALFDATWPSYEAWFLSQGPAARPTYRVSKRALEEHMPELVPTYERLVELAGGGDVVARFLSLYCPAPYLGACSQVAWTRGEPALVRNYDYSAPLCEATVVHTSWLRPVIAMSDCLWGALDGVNDAGLAISLAFGGRKVVGHGFGIPLVLRYILETCTTVADAAKVLERVPVHMAYNVTAIDRESNAITAYVAPDRPAVITDTKVATNHQFEVEWEEHAEATHTVERERCLLDTLAAAAAPTLEDFAAQFLRPPIYLASWDKGWGTLYTAVYSAARGEAEYRWPNLPAWKKSFANFREDSVVTPGRM